jgi:hypothetical protein
MFGNDLFYVALFGHPTPFGMDAHHESLPKTSVRNNGCKTKLKGKTRISLTVKVICPIKAK